MTHKNRYYDATKPHHTVDGFINIEPFIINHKDVKKWRKERRVEAPNGGYEDFKKNWYQDADFSVSDEGIWWLGHATSLIKVKNRTILTDPIFSNRSSPVRFLGPKRKTPCATTIESLPRIDIVVISHNHYDHLDYPSMSQLIKRFPLITIVVPLGLRLKLQSWGAKQVIELDWWDNTCIDGVTITAIPAHHWSRRAIFDTNRSLWSGWVMEYANKTIYFMGDTGYSAIFKEVKQRFPHLDYALIPIGCYAPRWFMHNQHIDPEQAVQLYYDIGCRRAIATHWGAFELADEPLDEPPTALAIQLERYQVSNDSFLIPKIGGYIPID